MISAVGPGPNGVGRVRLGRENGELRVQIASASLRVPVVKVIESPRDVVVVAPGGVTVGVTIT